MLDFGSRQAVRGTENVRLPHFPACMQPCIARTAEPCSSLSRPQSPAGRDSPSVRAQRGPECRTPLGNWVGCMILLQRPIEHYYSAQRCGVSGFLPSDDASTRAPSRTNDRKPDGPSRCDVLKGDGCGLPSVPVSFSSPGAGAFQGSPRSKAAGHTTTTTMKLKRSPPLNRQQAEAMT